MAQPFDATQHKTTGDAVVVVDHVDSSGPQFGLFSASADGLLMYTAGATRLVERTWFERSGKSVGQIGKPEGGTSIAISPDGSTIAFDRFDSSGGSEVWLYDVARRNESRLTFGFYNVFPIWSPDSSRVAYYTFREGVAQIMEKARGADTERVLFRSQPDQSVSPSDRSRDGQYLVVVVSIGNGAQQDIWAVPLTGSQKAFPYLESGFNESGAKLSPDGRWMAYASDETNQFEVYVQSFPKPGGKVTVSTGGGAFPVWSRDGKELYFIGNVNGNSMLMAVSTDTSGGTFHPGQPTPLFPVRLSVTAIQGNGYPYDVSKDGRFLIPARLGTGVPFTVIVNWDAGL